LRPPSLMDPQLAKPMAPASRAPEHASPSCVAMVAEGQWHLDWQPLDPGLVTELRTHSCVSTLSSAETLVGDVRCASTASMPGARALDEHMHAEEEEEPSREAAPEAPRGVARPAIRTSLSVLAVSVAALGLCWLGVLKAETQGAAPKPAALVVSHLLRRTETLAHYTYHHGVSGLASNGASIDALFEHMIVGSQL